VERRGKARGRVCSFDGESLAKRRLTKQLRRKCAVLLSIGPGRDRSRLPSVQPDGPRRKGQEASKARLLHGPKSIALQGWGITANGPMTGAKGSIRSLDRCAANSTKRAAAGSACRHTELVVCATLATRGSLLGL